MDEIILLTSLATFLLLAAVCSIIFNKIKLPPLIGYLMAGIILSNLWSITEIGEEVVEILSNMGLIILMFCLGLEINMKKIRKQGLFAMEVALVQLPVTMLLGIVIGSFVLGLTSLQSMVIGAIMSGSSTAVVLAVMSTHNLLDSDHKATLILVLIMEDIGQVILLSVLTPMMAGSSMDPGGLAAMIVSIIVFMLVSIFAGLRLMPRVINWLSDNVSSEVLTIFAVGMAFGMALLANFAGLSVAIGAFLMGMMIASSRKSREITHDIEPMKNIFMAMFFISVGMEIQIETLIDNIGMIVVIYGMFATLIISTVFLGYWMGNENPRTGFISAISLAVMGEFAFIIAKQALDYNVIDVSFYTSVVGAALLSMVILPIIAKKSGIIWDGLSKRCPTPLRKALLSVDYVKTSAYARVNRSSKKTKKEFQTTLRNIYIYIVAVVVIEIAFIMLSTFFEEWGMKYFGGGAYLWSMIVLVLNLIVIYVPIIRIINNIKTISVLTNGGHIRKSSRTQADTFMEWFMRSNTPITGLIVSITIIIIIPNDLGIWEHIVVLIVALAVLLLYNRKAIKYRSNMGSYTMGVDEYEIVDTDMFLKMLNEKVREQELLNEEKYSVSIDTGDMRKE